MKIQFWSSTEYSGFLAGLMRELTESCFEAEQCFQISEASYRSAKSTPARLFLRFRQYVAYPVQLIVALLKRKLTSEQEDVIVVSTNTFYAPLIATYLHPNVVHLVYDLFPEAMIHSGKWKEGTFKVKVIRWITKQTLKRSKRNVFLGERLKDYVESIHGPVTNASIIAVGADQSLFRLSPKQRLKKVESGKLQTEPGEDGAGSLTTPHGSLSTHRSAPALLYCGNFGNMHDSNTLFSYWNRVAQKSEDSGQDSEFLELNDFSASSTQARITFNFFCSGPKRAALEAARAGLPDALQQRIQIGEGLAQAAWITTMEAADVALVTMAPGAETVVMPSKTYSAMMAGQAILAIAPEGSDLVDLVQAADCGWWLKPGDLERLSEVLDMIASDAEGLLEKRENAFQYAHIHFGQDALAQAWQSCVLDTFEAG